MNIQELPESLTFEWDEFNQTKVRLRHNITIEEAERPFFSHHIVWFDEKHSASEKRYQLLGISYQAKILFIVFTIRGSKIRIISARRANNKERLKYYEKI